MVNVQALLQQFLMNRMSPRPQLPGLPPQGGLSGFGGIDPRLLSQFGPQMMTQSNTPTGPQVIPPAPPASLSLADVGNANVGQTGPRSINPLVAQAAMGLLQRSQQQPIQFTPFMQFRGGR
jgi:hypothetical protein